MFFDRVVNLRNSVFLDYKTDEFNSTEKSLIHSYKVTKDEVYALELMNMYESMFIKQASRVNRKQDREDLVSILIEMFFNILDEYDSSLSNFSYYLNKRLIWKTNDYIRDHLSREPTFLELDNELLSDNPISIDEPEEDNIEMYKILDKLNYNERLVVEMVMIQGLSHQEVADATGLKRRSIKHYSATAKAKLRKAYTEMGKYDTL